MSNILIFAVAALHLLFMVLEMFLWNTPFGRQVFSLTPEFAAASQKLAANQGLYNGFLAAGLGWGVTTDQFDVKVFFLACVIVAGIFGGLTVKKSILVIQALPAIVALIVTYIAP